MWHYGSQPVLGYWNYTCSGALSGSLDPLTRDLIFSFHDNTQGDRTFSFWLCLRGRVLEMTFYLPMDGTDVVASRGPRNAFCCELAAVPGNSAAPTPSRPADVYLRLHAP